MQRPSVSSNTVAGWVALHACCYILRPTLLKRWNACWKAGHAYGLIRNQKVKFIFFSFITLIHEEIYLVRGAGARPRDLLGVGADASARDGLASGGAALGITGAQGLEVDGRRADQGAVLGAGRRGQGASGGGGHAGGDVGGALGLEDAGALGDASGTGDALDGDVLLVGLARAGEGIAVVGLGASLDELGQEGHLEGCGGGAGKEEESASRLHS